MNERTGFERQLNQLRTIILAPSKRFSQEDDSYIRKAAIKHKIPYVTTPAAAFASAKGIAARVKGQSSVKSLQQYHSEIESA